MNTSNQFDVAILIGRFQPFHKGHQALLKQALETASTVIVVLGSSYQARNAKNPFTREERMAMIKSALDEATANRVSFTPVRDYYDDKGWCKAVNDAVSTCCDDKEKRIALIGFQKDASSYYLSRFPNWTFVESPQYEKIDATSIRKIYFEGDNAEASNALFTGLLPASIISYLHGWKSLPHFAAMQKEHRAIESGKIKRGEGPFITVDAVVTASQHVLLVRRGGVLGNGLWAIPGGFLEPRERLLQGAIRELKEETGFSMLNSSMELSLKEVAVFDHVDRSLRGRTITHAHWFDFGDSRLTSVTGADDAAEARWFPIAELPSMEETFFEDHFSILRHFLLNKD